MEPQIYTNVQKQMQVANPSQAVGPQYKCKLQA